MLPWPVSLILMMIFAAFISFALLYFYNRFGVNRKKKLTRSWPSELTAEQLNEELFNYGKLNGKAVDSTKVSLNLDIQEKLCEIYNCDLNEAVKKYSEGAVEGNRE